MLDAALYPDFVARPAPALYLTDNYIVLDVETTNREKGTALEPANSLLLARWRRGPGHPNADRGRDACAWGDEFSQRELVSDIERAAFFVAHNTKFELGWLRRVGVDLRKVLPYCTMIGEKIIAGNRRLPGKFPLSLESTAERRGLGSKATTVASLIGSGVCPSEIPRSLLEEYCAQDVALTERIFLEQRSEIASVGLLPVTYSRNLVTPVLADMEFQGMPLDAERVKETCADYLPRYDRLVREFEAFTGGINFKSRPQLRQYFYETLKFDELKDARGNPARTKGGNARTDKATIAALVATTPEQKEFKRLAGELSKLAVPVQNLLKMQDICEASPNDPRVYAVFNQTRTATDRLSSTGRKSGFQFHNFDRAFKRLFRSRGAGRQLVEGDAPQLEFRVAAFLGNDPVAKGDIQAGVDVHANTASAMYGKVTPELRQEAKRTTFKPLYGGRSGTARQRKYFDYFRSRYDGVYRVQSGWTLRVVRDKFLITPWGYRFYWPDTKMSTDGYVSNTTQIYNYPVQSFATAEIIPLVLVMVWHRIGRKFTEEECVLVNTVHDSIVADCKDETLDSLVEILVKCFTRDIYSMLRSLYGIEFDVQLGVGIKCGVHWGDAPERKFEAALCGNQGVIHRGPTGEGQCVPRRTQSG